jgi:hypothetical protein
MQRGTSHGSASQDDRRDDAVGLRAASVVALIFGVICIGIGLAYLFSERFITFALGTTTQGWAWSKLLGETWSRLASKFVFSAASLAFGGYLVYVAFAGVPAP